MLSTNPDIPTSMISSTEPPNSHSTAPPAVTAAPPTIPSLAAFHLSSTPYKTIYYNPTFIPSHSSPLIPKLLTSPKPKWTVLSNRRLQQYGGSFTPANKFIPEKFPEWLIGLQTSLKDLNIFGDNVPPNHVLINEYLPGQGILPHEDGPNYAPIIATISLGSYTLLEFYKSDDTDRSVPEFMVLLEPGSLVVLTDEVYEGYCHGIRECEVDVINENVIRKIVNFDKTEVAERWKEVVEKEFNGDVSKASLTLKRETRWSFTWRVAKNVVKIDPLKFLQRK